MHAIVCAVAGVSDCVSVCYLGAADLPIFADVVEMATGVASHL